MKLSAQKKKYAVVLLALIFAFLGWDFYMRTNWDRHITSSAPEYFYFQRIGEKAGTGISLYGEELSSLPDHYKKPVEIVRRNGSYYWINNNNLQLKKSVESRSNHKNSYKGAVFSSRENQERIIVDLNHYLTFSESNEFGCFPGGWGGNTRIFYKFDEQRYLVASARVKVYENAVQYLFCRNYF